MSGWLWVAALFFVALALAGVRCATGTVAARVVGLQIAATVAVLLFLALGQLLHQSTFTIVAIVAGVSSYVTNLTFVRYLEDRL